MWTQTKPSLYALIRGDNFTLNGRSLKITYLGINVSSTENDITMRLAKVSVAIDRLSVIWKLDLPDKIKRSFFLQAAVVSVLLFGCTTWTLTERIEKKLDGNSTEVLLKECFELYLTNPGGNTPQNGSYTATHHQSRKPSRLDK